MILYLTGLIPFADAMLRDQFRGATAWYTFPLTLQGLWMSGFALVALSTLCGVTYDLDRTSQGFSSR